MASFDLRFEPSVARDLRGIPRGDVQRILARIEALRSDPRPTGCEKLSGQERYRVREGHDRILYRVADTEVVVEIVEVGHRREVHRSV
jgi:mRNA interferase RelE/StbE